VYALWGLITLAIFLSALLVTTYLAKRRSRHLLTEKDTIVLADFANTTDDPVFDDTLEIEPTITAALPVRWQTSRAVSSLRRSPGDLPMRRTVSSGDSSTITVSQARIPALRFRREA
jgi:hypothetical protein